MSLPKISIVTPSFNQGEFLEATIRSVLSQNYPNLEYIIIDGGSTDGSVEIIKKYEKSIHYWISEPDQGQYDAINRGFSRATGEILAWLNSDDMYFPWAFRTVSNIMSEHHDIEWLTTLSPAYWDWHGYCVKISDLIPGYSKEAYLDGCYIPERYRKKKILALYDFIQQESTFWKRSLWERMGGCISSKYKLAADFDLWGTFYQYAELYGTMSPLAGFRLQGKQKTTQQETYEAEAEKSLCTLRESVGWSPNYFREACVKLKLGEIPKLRRYVLKKSFYVGKKVIRLNASLREGSWEVVEHKFFRKE
jgi:glycosyltransferase involved in cell wall biosynthesis